MHGQLPLATAGSARRPRTPPHAPVPQAAVAPLPRSQVSMVTSPGPFTSTKCTLVRSGKIGCVSSRRPSSRSRSGVSSFRGYAVDHRVRVAHRHAGHLAAAAERRIDGVVDHLVGRELDRQVLRPEPRRPHVHAGQRDLAVLDGQVDGQDARVRLDPQRVVAARGRGRRRTWPRSGCRCRTSARASRRCCTSPSGRRPSLDGQIRIRPSLPTPVLRSLTARARARRRPPPAP